MTVRQLIEKLEEFPDDMEVIDYEYNHIEIVELSTDYYYNGAQAILIK